MITNSARSLRILGTLNGVSVSVSAMGRAAGPAVGGAVFSLAIKRGYVIAPWWIFSVVAILGAIPLCFVVEGKGFGEDEDVKNAGDGSEEPSIDGDSNSGRDDDNNLDHVDGENSQSVISAKHQQRRKSSRKKHDTSSPANSSSDMTSSRSTSTHNPTFQNTSNSNTIVGDDDDDYEDASSRLSSYKPLLKGES